MSRNACKTTLARRSTTARTRRGPAGAGLLALALLVASQGSAPAAAQGGSAPGAARPGWRIHKARSRGLMFEGSFGVSGCTDHACDGLDPLVFFRTAGLFRLLPFLAVGVHFGMPFFNPDSRFVDHAYEVFLGGEVRGILPIGPLDLWTAMAMGWNRAESREDICAGGVCVSGKVWADGFGFAWGTGAQYYVMRRLALGVDFWLHKGVYDKRCSETDWEHVCWDVDNDDVGITWMVGASVVYFLPF